MLYCVHFPTVVAERVIARFRTLLGFAGMRFIMSATVGFHGHTWDVIESLYDYLMMLPQCFLLLVALASCAITMLLST